MTGYKLFEQNRKGQLFPLFIGAKTETKTNEWLHAEFLPTKGFAPRGGWHIGMNVPDAPWLKDINGGYSSRRWKTGRRVWCEVEYNSNNDYNDYVQTLLGKQISDGIPENGFYYFREVGKGIWCITSDIKITRILTEDERQQIIAAQGYDEAEAYAPYHEAMVKARATREAKKAH